MDKESNEIKKSIKLSLKIETTSKGYIKKRSMGDILHALDVFDLLGEYESFFIITDSKNKEYNFYYCSNSELLDYLGYHDCCVLICHVNGDNDELLYTTIEFSSKEYSSHYKYYTQKCFL